MYKYACLKIVNALRDYQYDLAKKYQSNFGAVSGYPTGSCVGCKSKAILTHAGDYCNLAGMRNR